MLILLASVLCLVGVLCTPVLVEVLAPGFSGPTLEATIHLVRVLFPGIALLVLSAFCVGVLNSHGRFFLSYVAPVLFNAALIAAAIVAGRRFAGRDFEIATWLAWGAVVGAAVQLLAQLPSVISLLRSALPAFAVRDADVATCLRTFVPVLLGRGSVQVSGYIDQMIASYLGRGMVAAIANAQTLYLLPVSLFGMAVSAAELPAMSGAIGDDAARAEQLRARLLPAQRRVLFLVIPSAVAFVLLGDSIVSLLFQSGRFNREATETVWLILVGSSLGLPSATQGRLIASALYALGDPRAPLRAALLRVALTATCGFLLALPLRAHFGYGPAFGAFGLTLASGLAAWVEYALLRRGLSRFLGPLPQTARLGFGALAVALGSGALGRLVSAVVLHASGPSWLAAGLALGAFGGGYLGVMALCRVPEAHALWRRALRLRPRR